MELEKRALDSALGQSGLIGQHAQTRFDRLPTLTSGAAVKEQIDEKRRRLLIVTDDVAHQNIENVVVNRRGFAKTGHIRLQLPYQLYR